LEKRGGLRVVRIGHEIARLGVWSVREIVPFRLQREVARAERIHGGFFVEPEAERIHEHQPSHDVGCDRRDFGGDHSADRMAYKIHRARVEILY
jgi:hypothetical protein